ncbi:hypothetical protein [Streptomyces sp. BBFR109]|uniref:hypothetical protein n=1 Tax=Streptomyces sp. BBFR109 TaxID=3448172 RepID=UPI003F776783
MAHQSNDQIYELINQLRLEIKGDIKAQGDAMGEKFESLDTKLDKVVEDRIKPIEKDVSDLKISSATGNTKLGALIFIGSSLVSSIITWIATKVLS